MLTGRNLIDRGKNILGVNSISNIVGMFGSITFEVSAVKVLSINGDLQRTNSARIGEHTPVTGVGMLWHQGRELKTISFPIILTSALGVDIAVETKKLENMIDLGEYSYMVLGGNVMGQFPYILTGFTETMKSYSNITSLVDVCEITLELKEYIENPSIYDAEIAYKKAIKTVVTEEAEGKVLLEQAGGIE